MKYIELIFAIIILTIISSIMTFDYYSINKIQNKTNELKIELNRDERIVTSFQNCIDNDQSIILWKQRCSEVFSISKIEVIKKTQNTYILNYSTGTKQVQFTYEKQFKN